MDLPRRLGRLDTTAIVVGSMIGSGIFLKASAIATLLPDPRWVLAIWAASGALTFFGALSLAELDAARPRSGGLYVHLTEAYGPLVGYLFGWSLLAVLQTGSIAGLAAGIAQTADQRFPMSDATELAVAGGLIVLLSAVNALSVRAGAGVQNTLTGAKCLGILALIGGGFFLARGSLANLLPAETSPGEVGLVGAVGLAMVKALWAYDGWVNASFVAGEVRDPQRNLPAALMLGTGLVTALYLATNAAYHYTLSVPEVQGAKSVAVVVAERATGPAGALGMLFLTMVSMTGTMNSSILSGARVYFAMARDGSFVPALGAVHPRFRTPHLSIVAQCLWSLVLLVWWGTFERLTDNVVFLFFIFYGLGAVAVLLVRRRHPERERPYRVPGTVVPLVFALAALFLTVNTLVHSPKESLQTLALLGAGLATWPLVRRRSQNGKSYHIHNSFDGVERSER